MSEADSARAVLLDSFVRVHDMVIDLTDGLTEEVASFRPDDEANPIGWLVWHLARIQDDHVAGLADVDQVWEQWRERFDVPFDADATGYGQTSAEVGALRVDGEELLGYHSDVHALTLAYLDRLDDAELARVVDSRWDPPVTVSVRLVSVIGDCLQHLGQAAYVRGLAERRADEV